MDSPSDHASLEKQTSPCEKTFDAKAVDVGAQLTAGSDVIVDPETSLRLR